jgi:hypothetical protein
MRKQYRFRASLAGLQAWDVDRLVELAKDLPRQRVRLASIREIDEAYWSNEGTTQMTYPIEIHRPSRRTFSSVQCLHGAPETLIARQPRPVNV